MDRGIPRSIFVYSLVTAAGATAAACTGIFCAAVAVTFAAMASARAPATTFGIRAADSKPCAALRVIDKVDRGIAEIIDGDFVHNHFYAVGFKGGIDVAEVIVEGHAKVYTAASTTGDIY